MPGRPKSSNKVILKEEAGELFLFNCATGEIRALNSTGAFIWKLCDGKRSREDIISRILKKFSVESKNTAAKDLQKFLSALNNSGFILER
ncbi:MAG: PqqD family protein [Candidatus Omnitrophota bacterium]|nr:PqqD family protein [Candidatus Omnitrophota bacterium]